MLSEGNLAEIVLLVLALGLSLLSLRIGAFGWLITTFAWVGLAAAAQQTWISGVSIGLAFLCLILFIRGAR